MGDLAFSNDLFFWIGLKSLNSLLDMVDTLLSDLLLLRRKEVLGFVFFMGLATTGGDGLRFFTGSLLGIVPVLRYVRFITSSDGFIITGNSTEM